MLERCKTASTKIEILVVKDVLWIYLFYAAFKPVSVRWRGLRPQHLDVRMPGPEEVVQLGVRGENLGDGLHAHRVILDELGIGCQKLSPPVPAHVAINNPTPR